MNPQLNTLAPQNRFSRYGQSVLFQGKPQSVQAESAKRQQLQLRFEALATQLGVPEVDARKTFSQLMNGYEDLTRCYHNKDHLMHLFALWDDAQKTALPRDLPQDNNLVELALWFHDFVDDRGNPKAIQQSAQQAVDFLKGSSLPHYQSAAIQKQLDLMVRITDYFNLPSPTELATAPDAEWIQDIDLAGLGCDPVTFTTNTADIRAELPHKTDAEFLAGQNKFLAKLLQRPRIYYTDWAYQRYEQQARLNIQQLINQTP